MKGKLFSSLIASAILLAVGTQSASAQLGDDSRPFARWANPDWHYTAPLLSSSDEDWYYWINETDSYKFIWASVQSPAGLNYDIRGFVVTPSGQEYEIHSNESGPGGIDSFGIGMNPGDKIYFRIRPDLVDYNPTLNYDFRISY
ncbi:hypothetical protein QJ48_07000 [Paenibacillus sp. A3]|uniref:hypothetical protein n=1 Tax=Paenibacillus sp. A3 TaxID=1337054 RepID=UPI0006D52FE5|nr:hypothetical protein [Paenibacillus sp. A3]KPV60130.1 hypothetical protein QJ48_07000 [Paenibacillus sp. A3]